MRRLKLPLLLTCMGGMMLLVACASVERTVVDSSSDAADSAVSTITEEPTADSSSDMADSAEAMSTAEATVNSPSDTTDSTEGMPAQGSEPPANSENAAEPALETVEVADGLYSFGNGEVFGAFLVTDEGVVVMDSVNTDFATEMLAAIREVTDQPIELLIYSHNHWDHIAGGQVFKDEGATIMAHGDAQEWLANHPAPNPAVLIPDETWDGARHDVVLGGKTIQLHHFGPSHGEGMTVFRFPEEHSIFTVDLVVPKRVGFAYMPDFTPHGWIATLYAIEELEYETVMFSHNAAFGPRSSVMEQREFLEDLQTEIVARMQAGDNPFAIVNTIELPKYQEWAGYDDWLSMNAWRIMLEMWMGQ